MYIDILMTDYIIYKLSLTVLGISLQGPCPGETEQAVSCGWSGHG